MVTVAAVVCAWLGHEYHVVQERQAMRAWIEKHGGICTSDASLRESPAEKPSLIRRWLGDERLDEVLFIPPAHDAEIARVKAAFPGTVVRNMQW